MSTSLEVENPALHVQAVSVAKEKFSLCKPAVQSTNEITRRERLSMHGLGEITYQLLQDNTTSLTSHATPCEPFANLSAWTALPFACLFLFNPSVHQ
jgi:hypothetical protein